MEYKAQAELLISAHTSYTVLTVFISYIQLKEGLVYRSKAMYIASHL